MRIAWHSAAPWEGTGYGTQTAAWTRRLRDAGHDVAITAYHGLQGDQVAWEGIPVYPAPLANETLPEVLRGHLARIKPDLVIVLCDTWLGFPPETFRGYRTGVWMPVDLNDHVNQGDGEFLTRGHWIRPIAMSQDGERVLRASGFDPLYVPHGIDTQHEWTPLEREERAAARQLLGLGPDTFAVGINATLVDPERKAWFEQAMAFKRFHGKHPDSVLFCHTMRRWEGGLDIEQLLLAGVGLPESAFRIADQYKIQTGGFDSEHMRAWYASMDVVMNATEGEGFGLPGLEAQACGTPVILAKNTTGPELVGPGWLAKCQPKYNPRHVGQRATVLIDSLADCLDKAWAARTSPFKRQAARQHATKWDVETVWPLWEKALTELAS